MQYSKNREEVLRELKTSTDGLDNNEVLERQKNGSINKLDCEKKQSLVSKFFAQFKDLMVIVLIISAVLSIGIAIGTHEYQNLFEGGIIIFIVLLNATFGVVQEHKADNALETLKKHTLQYSHVFRNGKAENVKAEDLVVGDVVMLSCGNIVPADVRLIETYNFKVNEFRGRGAICDGLLRG